jgi:hypothetical protein
VNGSFAAGKRAINRGKLRAAVAAKNEHTVYAVMSRAIEAFQKNLTPKLAGVLGDTLNASGTESAKKLKAKLQARHASIRSMGFRTAAPQIASFSFDKTNPNALKWVDDHAADTVEGISDTTREDIKDLVEQAFQGDFDVDELTDRIADLIGDPVRADVIARTETMRASNEGQRQAWDQAVDEGLLTGHEQQVWIITPDDRLCPDCEPFGDVVADLNGTFRAEGVDSDGPPLHPRCRCTVGLTLES